MTRQSAAWIRNVVDATWTPLGPDDLRTTRVSGRRAAVVVAAKLLIERPA